jgi:hypothetical protein
MAASEDYANRAGPQSSPAKRRKGTVRRTVVGVPPKASMSLAERADVARALVCALNLIADQIILDDCARLI